MTSRPVDRTLGLGWGPSIMTYLGLRTMMNSQYLIAWPSLTKLRRQETNNQYTTPLYHPINTSPNTHTPLQPTLLLACLRPLQLPYYLTTLLPYLAEAPFLNNSTLKLDKNARELPLNCGRKSANVATKSICHFGISMHHQPLGSTPKYSIPQIVRASWPKSDIFPSGNHPTLA